MFRFHKQSAGLCSKAFFQRRSQRLRRFKPFNFSFIGRGQSRTKSSSISSEGRPRGATWIHASLRSVPKGAGEPARWHAQLRCLASGPAWENMKICDANVCRHTQQPGLGNTLSRNLGRKTVIFYGRGCSRKKIFLVKEKVFCNAAADLGYNA
jgi:hypothetical protein